MATADELIATWALRVATGSRRGIAALRDRDGIEVCEQGAHVWLRGARADASLWRALAAVPGGERFVVDAGGACRAPGSRLPTGQLPGGPWIELREASRVEFAMPALPGELPAPLSLAVVRGGALAEPSLLRCRLGALARWVDEAAEVRMNGLRFVASAQGEAFVHGLPMPPLPGAPFVVTDGIAVPAGCRLALELPPTLLSAKCRLADGDLLVVAVDGSGMLLPGVRFVALTRSAVRATMAVVARG